MFGGVKAVAAGGGGGLQTYYTGSDFSYASYISFGGGGVSIRDVVPGFVTTLTGLGIGDTFVGVSGGVNYTFTITTTFTSSGLGAGGVYDNYDGSATTIGLSGFNEITSIIISSGGGTTFTPSSYGDETALAVVKDGAGYKYIAAQRFAWAVPADYDTLAALPSGTVFTVVLTGGTYTFTTTSKGGTPGTDVNWYGEFSPTISGTVSEAPSSITFGGT
jgi:hypothetical protein